MAPSTSLPLFFFFFSTLFFISQSQITARNGLMINCGSSRSIVSNGLSWTPDSSYITTGSSASLKRPNTDPVFSTLRYFNETARKSCFVLPVLRGIRYLVRTAYFYGGFDGRNVPPVFDQIVDGTFWSTVNTSKDYAMNRPSFYELILAATRKTISVCVARNKKTTTYPFISAIQLIRLEGSVYNSTDFGKHALSTVARHAFGYGGKTIRFPDDQFDRFWDQFPDNQSFSTTSNVSVTGFWNMPPSKVFDTGLTPKEGKKLELQWPSVALQNSSYYIALYFRHHQVPGSPPWRALSVSVNNVEFYRNLNVTPGGEVVFATRWPLFNFTRISLSASAQSAVGPVINAGELLQIVNLGGRTLTRDVIALEALKRSMLTPPLDWNGDPCLPQENSWTGVTCYEGSRVRVVRLNLTGMGISGSLPPLIAKMSALDEIWLGYNKFSGTIPDLRPLKRLKILHLENNELNGTIPSTLGMVQNLRELYLQNNNLTGKIPANLRKAGLHLQISPGNPLLRR
ncbi:probable LRR receptor-like serine/threonine-protein kinase At1g67720 [Nymphaea colorata]|nr:probable LRR receptor-like serine/threonine-protein kinase At1g67720 [Nymphaea colorata]